MKKESYLQINAFADLSTGKNSPIPSFIPAHQLFGDHVAPYGAKIVVIIGDYNIDFPFRIEPVFFKGFYDFFQYAVKNPVKRLPFSLGLSKMEGRKSVRRAAYENRYMCFAFFCG